MKYWQEKEEPKQPKQTPHKKKFSNWWFLVLFTPLVVFGAINCNGPKPNSTPTHTAPVSPVLAKDIIKLTNEQRTERDVHVLVSNEKLMAVAQRYADLMDEKDQLSHDIDGRTLSKRIGEVDYHWIAIGENIAYNYPSAESVIDGWMQSPGHRANILNPVYKEIGVGISGRYYCQVFGCPK